MDADGPWSLRPQTTSPQTQREEHLFGAHKAFIASMHAAEALTRVERYLDTVDTEGAVDQKEIERLLAGMPHIAKDQLQAAIQNYFDLKKYALECKQLMEKDIRGSMDAYGWDVAEAERMYGERIFSNIALVAPRGRVTCRIEDSCLIVFCENWEDYSRLCAEGEGYLSWDAPPTWTIGHYSHLIKLVPFNKIPIGLIGIYGSAEDAQGNGDVKDTVDHEKQHFINNAILGIFSDIKSAGEESVEMRGIKDELIAKIRSAKEKSYILEIWDTYPHLFSNLTLKERTIAAAAIKALASYMEKRGFFSARRRAPSLMRSELVYRLTPRPLKDWSAWINLMERYDERQKKSVEST